MYILLLPHDDDSNIADRFHHLHVILCEVMKLLYTVFNMDNVVLH